MSGVNPAYCRHYAGVGELSYIPRTADPERILKVTWTLNKSTCRSSFSF